jgi:hypothetical protein
VEEEYSLRYIGDALITYQIAMFGKDKINLTKEQSLNVILLLDKELIASSSKVILPGSFLNAAKLSMRSR